MRRPLVFLLAALDAVVTVTVGVAVILAPLTLMWVLAFGAAGSWDLLWPVTASIWQFGHGVPLEITIPEALVVALAIDPDAAHFTLSLAPLAFLMWTLTSAARSGARSARVRVWQIGVVAGTATMAGLAWLIALLSRAEHAQASIALAVFLPALVYFLGALSGAVVTAWRSGDRGPVDHLRGVLERNSRWGEVPAQIVRGGAIVVVTLLGLGAVLFTVAVVASASEMVALFEALRVDALGATIITLGQLAYVPTFIFWAISWLAGPGFAVGAGTAVSPVGTELGIVPAIPIFAALPEGTSMWALIVILAPVAAGAFAAWAIRSRLVRTGGEIERAPRAVIALGIAAIAAGFGAVSALLSSGSIGPERLALTGPHAGMLALALGVEVLIGAAILLLSPRNRGELAAERG